MKFELKPRLRRDGFTLTSSILPFPTWYISLHEAIGYARFLGRDEGCEIKILNATGLVTDLIEVLGQPLSTTGKWKSIRRISILRGRATPKHKESSAHTIPEVAAAA